MEETPREETFFCGPALHPPASAMRMPCDEQQTKRLLRQQIGRLRRRIDGRVRDVRQQGRELASWRTYIQQHPGLAVLAALTLGVAAAYGMKRGGWGENPAVQRAERLLRSLFKRVWREGKRWWTGSTTAGSPAPAEGGAHGQS